MADTQVKQPGFFDKFNNPSIWITLLILFSAGAITYNNVGVIGNRLDKKIVIQNEIKDENDEHNIDQAVSKARQPLLLEIIDLKGQLRQKDTEIMIKDLYIKILERQ